MSTPLPPEPRLTGSERVADWIGWHLIELTTVGVPGALALTVDGWFAVLSVLSGAGWAATEIRINRRQRAALQAPVRSALPVQHARTDSTDQTTSAAGAAERK